VVCFKTQIYKSRPQCIGGVYAAFGGQFVWIFQIDVKLYANKTEKPTTSVGFIV